MSYGRMLEGVARQARLANELEHRPWPLPEAPWLEAQTRHAGFLAFWPVQLDELARLLPPELAADTFEGQGWAGVSAGCVTGLRVRGLPPLPGLSSFSQLEVVAPVVAGDRPGLWLFSLEVPKGLLAEAAKRVHRLPAYRARVVAARDSFEAERQGLAFRAGFRGTGEPRDVVPGTLEHFLVERYALYTADGGRLYRVEVHHPPARLQKAEATVEAATLVPLTLEGAPRAFLAAEQDVLVWPLEEVR